MRKQAGRKNFVIVSFGVPLDLLRQIEEAVAEQNKNTREAPLNKSEWLRRAVERDLDHRQRSRRSKRNKAA